MHNRVYMPPATHCTGHTHMTPICMKPWANEFFVWSQSDEPTEAASIFADLARWESWDSSANDPRYSQGQMYGIPEIYVNDPSPTDTSDGIGLKVIVEDWFVEIDRTSLCLGVVYDNYRIVTNSNALDLEVTLDTCTPSPTPAPTPSPSSVFFLGSPGENTCPAFSSHIQDSDVCRQANDETVHRPSYQGIVHQGTPQGCYSDSMHNRVYMPPATHCTGHTHMTPICMKPWANEFFVWSQSDEPTEAASIFADLARWESWDSSANDPRYSQGQMYGIPEIYVNDPSPTDTSDGIGLKVIVEDWFVEIDRTSLCLGVVYDNYRIVTNSNALDLEVTLDTCTPSPTPAPTPSPTPAPTVVPSSLPTHVPTLDPTSSLTPVPSQVPTSSPTPVPSLNPTQPPSSFDICISPGSNCFAKSKEKGCEDEACTQNVCDKSSKCCSKKWSKKCFKIALKMCDPCVCSEVSDDLFLVKVSKNEPRSKTCGWLVHQKAKTIRKLCKKTASFESLKTARFVCPLQCNLSPCNVSLSKDTDPKQ